jgi:hypothetical protein
MAAAVGMPAHTAQGIRVGQNPASCGDQARAMPIAPCLWMTETIARTAGSMLGLVKMRVCCIGRNTNVRSKSPAYTKAHTEDGYMSVKDALR